MLWAQCTCARMLRSNLGLPSSCLADQLTSPVRLIGCRVRWGLKHNRCGKKLKRSYQSLFRSFFFIFFTKRRKHRWKKRVTDAKRFGSFPSIMVHCNSLSQKKGVVFTIKFALEGAFFLEGQVWVTLCSHFTVWLRERRQLHLHRNCRARR